MKAATKKPLVEDGKWGFQSTPPVKAATRHNVAQRVIRPISIHAAREGGDWLYAWNQYDYVISIHAAREGGDPTAQTSMRAL